MKISVPRITLPSGACDTHMHFYDGAASAKPGTPNPGNFSVAMYRELQRKLGLERVIVVQPNAYGDDNRCTIYDVRPAACREYPHTDKEGFTFRTMLHANNAKQCPAVFWIVEQLRLRAKR